MQQVRHIVPLSYIEPSGGTVTPGGVLVYAGGTAARWNSIYADDILDPSAVGVATIANLVTSYNDLAWKLYQTGFVTTEPRIWFGAAGADGVQLYLTGAPLAAAYAPYFGAGGAYSYISMSEVLAELNGMLGNTPEARFQYENSRVNLVVKSGSSIQFEENPAAYGSTRRMMNRLFLRDISGYIGAPLTGPLLIQGQPIMEATYGVFPVPDAASNIQMSTTPISFTASWTASPTSNVIYYVRVQGGAYDALKIVKTSSIILGKIDGLQFGITYTVTVAASTPYEVSVSKPTGQSSFSFPVMNLAAAVGTPFYRYISLTWTPTPTSYPIVIKVGTDTPLTYNSASGRADIYKTQGGQYSVTYPVSAYFTYNGISGDVSTINVELLDIPAPNIALNGAPSSTSVSFTHTLLTPPMMQGTIQSIRISFMQAGNDQVNTYSYSTTSITISGLDPDTGYTFTCYYVLQSGIGGNSTVISTSTNLPSPNLTLGTVSATRITVNWPFISQDYTLIFTSPESFEYDPSITTFTFKLLLPSTAYTVSAYLKKNGTQGPISSINTTTAALPTVFGPINEGKTPPSAYTIVTLALSYPSNPNQFGVIIPSNSIYRNYTFKKLIFPTTSIPYYQNPQSTLISIGGAPSYAKVRVYSDYTRSQLITESNIVNISDAFSGGQVYTFTLPIVVTLLELMCILIEVQQGGGAVQVRYYFNDGNSLEGAVSENGNPNSIQTTNNIMLFNFSM